MSNTIVYIDGFNLYHSLINTPYKWLNIAKLAHSTLDSSRNHIVKIKYFTARTPFSESTQRQDLYLRALKTLQDVEIFYGKFKQRDIRLTKGYIERLLVFQRDSDKLKRIKEIIGETSIKLTRHEEKETDVNIATHITYDCCKEDIQSVALLSNDTDLKLPPFFARKVLNKKVIVITPTAKSKKGVIIPMNTHQDLQKISNKAINLTEDHLKSSQFPEEVCKGIYRPKKWSSEFHGRNK